MDTKLIKYDVYGDLNYNGYGDPYTLIYKDIDEAGEHTNANDAQKIIDHLLNRVAELEGRKTDNKYFGAYGIVKTHMHTITMPFLLVAKNKYEALGLLSDYLKTSFPYSKGYIYWDCNVCEPTPEQEKTMLGVNANETIVT